MSEKEKLIKEIRRLEMIEEVKAMEAAKAQDSFSTLDKAGNAVRSAAEGLTFGLSEPVVSGVKAAGYHLADVASGEAALTDTGNLSKAYDADVERRRLFEAQNPNLALGSEMVGAIAPIVLTGGAAALAKGVTGAGKLAASGVRSLPGAEALLASKGVMGSGARVAERAAVGATEAVVGEGIKQVAQQNTGFIKEGEGLDLKDVAQTGALFSGGLKALPELAGQGVRAARGAAKVFGGVNGESIDKYLANPERIRNAMSVEQIKEEVDATVQKLRDDFDNAKLSASDAKQALKEAEGKVDDLVRENKNILASERADLKNSMKSAQADLDIAFKQKQAEIKNARLPIQADDVLDSVEQVKTQVNELSEESYKILGLHKGKFKLNGITKQISQLQNELKVEGQLLSGDSEKAFSVLDSWKEKLKSIGAENSKGLEAGQMKKVIQEIDRDLRKYSDKMAGDYSDVVYNELLSMRRLLDGKLKNQVAGYREVMEETAKLNQLRGEFVKMFGSRERITSKLSRLDNPNLEFERNRLRELGVLSGKDWSPQIDDFVGTKNLGRSQVAIQDVKQSLPENEAYINALADYARTQRPDYGQDLLTRAATQSAEAQGLRAAEARLGSATDEVTRAKQALEPFKKITPANSENQIRTLMGDRSRKIELKALMGKLGQVSDQDLVQMIDDLRVKETFEKGIAQGSSNVNLWGAIAGGVGWALGDPTLGLSSAGAGAAFGKIMDSYGPKMVRKVLDGVVYMKGMPTVQKIDEVFADLPDELRNDLRSQLVRAVTIGNSTVAVSIPPDQRPDLARDIKSSENLSASEKAEAITQLNKKGALGSDTLQRVMVGEEKAEPMQYTPAPQRPPPQIDQVTDYIKTRKQEAY